MQGLCWLHLKDPAFADAVQTAEWHGCRAVARLFWTTSVAYYVTIMEKITTPLMKREGARGGKFSSGKPAEWNKVEQH